MLPGGPEVGRLEGSCDESASFGYLDVCGSADVRIQILSIIEAFLIEQCGEAG
jgi:hypothetical protein